MSTDNVQTNEDNSGEIVQDELETLKARAQMLGIQFHPSIGVEKLREKIAAEMAKDTGAPLQSQEQPRGLTQDVSNGSSTSQTAPVSAVQDPAVNPDVADVNITAANVGPETDGERRKRLRNEATKLVRIRVTCMNPAKKDWDGETFTVGNSSVGTLRKYVPFNNDEGWHVPHFIYEVMKARECQVFVSTKSAHGVTLKKGKMIKEFAIEVLPPLTPSELKDLAQRQALAGSID